MKYVLRHGREKKIATMFSIGNILNSFFCFSISSAVLRAALATSDEDWNQVQVLDNLKAVTRGFRGNNCWCSNAVP